jgi:hypothetical protein
MEQRDIATIDWSAPVPREGIAGAWDRFMGPGVTDAELWLTFIVGSVGGVVFGLYGAQSGMSVALALVLALVAFDVFGGVVANACGAAKRWYHRPGVSWRPHIGFVLAHGLHVFIVAWLFRAADWGYFAAVYGYLVAAALVVVATPLYLRRPVAMVAYLGGVLLVLYGFGATPGLEWFAPAFFLKLLVCHLVPEAPFRPNTAVHE